MDSKNRKKKVWRKWLLISGLLVITAVAITYWVVATEKFSDTSARRAAYSVNAIDFIREFVANDTAANKKYTEKIITVSGTISALEAPDTSTVNVKFIDTASGAFAIFAFQEQHLAEAKNLKPGDQVTIKGSCSGGVYDGVFEVMKINFKRSALEKK